MMKFDIDFFDLLGLAGIVLVAIAAYRTSFELLLFWIGLCLLRVAFSGARWSLWFGRRRG